MATQTTTPDTDDKDNDALRYTLKVGEIFRKKTAGLKQIDECLGHCRKARFSNLSPKLFNRFVGKLPKGAVIEVFLHEDVDESEFDIPKKVELERLHARWYEVLFGTKCHIGQILTATVDYRVYWTDDGKVHRVFAGTDPKCLQCLWKKNFMAKAREDQLQATVYDRREGLNLILRKAAKATVFRACILPPPLIKRILPFALRADYRVIFSRTDPLVPRFQGNFDARVGSKAKIFFCYGGEEANVGSLRLDHEMYSIFWRGNKVFNVMKFDNMICSNCICRVFDTAWKYSEELA